LPRRLALLFALSVVLASCTSRQTSTTPPAPPGPAQGWVELTLADREVPADPISLGSGQAAHPPRCHVEVEVAGRTVLSQSIEPAGSGPPYSVDSTFRFAMPAGEHATTVTYAGCRTFGDQLDSREARLRIPVRSGQVTFLRFDGTTLQALTPPEGIE
jgi:hypothetical protein